MQFFTGKTLRFEKRFRGHRTAPDLKLIAKDIASSFIILMILLALIVTLLVTKIDDLIKGIIVSQSIFAWVLTFANVLLLGFLLAVSITLLAKSLVDYRNIRNLHRFGVVTKGTLVDKWVDTSEEKPVYWVRYQYLAQFQAVQAVGKDVFQKLKRAEIVHVLHLEKLPHISRLVIAE